MNNTSLEDVKEIVRIHFCNAKEFYEHLKLLEVINDYQAFFTLNENGLFYNQMDPAHISAIFMKFKGIYESIKECKFGIYLGDFTRIISNEDLKNSKLTLEIDIANKRVRILINTINLEGELIDFDEENNIPEPKLIFDVEAEIDLRNLLNAIKSFDYIKISIENDKLFIEGRNEIVKKKTFIPSKFNNFKNGTLAYYNTCYLKNFLKKVVKLKNIAKLRFSNNKPLNISLETKIARIDYYLASRVEE